MRIASSMVAAPSSNLNLPFNFSNNVTETVRVYKLRNDRNNKGEDGIGGVIKEQKGEREMQNIYIYIYERKGLPCAPRDCRTRRALILLIWSLSPGYYAITAYDLTSSKAIIDS